VDRSKLKPTLSSGLPVVGVVQGTPGWADGDWHDGASGVPTGLDYPVDDPRNTFGQFMLRLTRTYKGRISTWVVWNEPDFLPGESGTWWTWSGSAGDFFKDELPKGPDVALLSMVLHDWSPEKDAPILEKCFQALPSGGALIVAELMMDDDKTGPAPAALMSLNMLIETEGRNYTWAEYAGWLEDAGFEGLRRIPIISPGVNGLIIGRKP